MDRSYDQLLRLVRKASIVNSVNEVLVWDRDVMMPRAESELRAKQMEVIGKLAHTYAVDKRIGQLLASIRLKGLSEEEQANVREIERDYNLATRVSTRLEGKLAAATSRGTIAWEKAKAENRFCDFLPHLELVLDLTKERAHALAPGKKPYDALIDEYEPGVTAEEFSALCNDIATELAPLTQAVMKAEREHPTPCLAQDGVPVMVQQAYLKKLAWYVGYNGDRGRIDTSAHPFSTGTGRITYRVEDGWLLSIFSVLHEIGHAKYEYGLPEVHFGTPLGENQSCGVHESQARLWENHVGKSPWFWRGQYGALVSAYSTLKSVSPEDFYRIINKVEPSFIRTDADELTYGLHVVLRFELERNLLEDKLRPKDLPEAWNERMRELLGVVPPTDTLGCLQDTHWAEGMFGYFPSYLYGSMIAAQLWEAIEHGIPQVKLDMVHGVFTGVNEWLGEYIYQHGRRYSTKELIENATGSVPSSRSYTQYLHKKYKDLYKIT